MSEPTSIRSGDSITWEIDEPNYGSINGWTLRYRIIPASGTAIDVAASPNGDTGWSVSIAPVVSAKIPSGLLTLVKIAEREGERVTISSQQLNVLQNLANINNLDGRSNAQRALDDAKAAMQDYLKSGRVHVAEYWVAGRKMQFRTLKDITDYIAILEREVRRELEIKLLAEGTPMSSAIRVQM